jgi:CheY-like chemotaxis protein
MLERVASVSRGGGTVALPPTQVLIVDDEPAILTFIRDALEGLDCEVCLALNAEEALELLRGTDGVALIVTDLKLPGADGVQLLEEARRLAPRAGRILMTGYPDSENGLNAVARGTADRFVTKPWSRDKIRKVVEVHLTNFKAEAKK